MRIEQSRASAEALNEKREALRRLTVVPDYHQQRPCHGCTAPCGCSKRSTSCACNCSPECSRAPSVLSSDPERYPIEPGVLPLVFELNASGLMQPCWSCEGHENAKAHVVRLPGVWFYSASTAYPQLLASHIADLTFRRQVAARWKVTLSPFSEDPLLATFCLEPQVDAPVSLDVLQVDLRAIAHDLLENLRCQARSALVHLSRR